MSAEGRGMSAAGRDFATAPDAITACLDDEIGHDYRSARGERSRGTTPPTSRREDWGQMPKYAGTATEFIVNLLTAQPDRLWRIADILTAAERRWTEKNVHKSLTRLFKIGKIGKTVTAGAAWWSSREGAAKATAALPPAERVATTRQAANAPKPGEPTASEFIIGLLRRHPDYEMRVGDVWEESGRKWAAQTVSNTLERLVTKGKIARVKDGRNVWYSIP